MNLQQKRMMELTDANYSVISRVKYSLLMQSFGCSSLIAHENIHLSTNGGVQIYLVNHLSVRLAKLPFSYVRRRINDIET
jgi:hypothetical protein